MKKLIVSASIILFVGLASFAQDGTKKCCDKKGDKKECSTNKKCEPKDCATNLQSGKCDPKDCPTGKDKSCKHGSTACADKKNDATKEVK